MTDLRDIAVDDDMLWIASQGGLLGYRPADGTWQTWTAVDGLVDSTCESVVLWHDDIWVGTQGGISRYTPTTDSWQSYTGEHGLPDVANVRLYVDPYADALWAGTFGGLALYDSLTDRWIAQQPDDIVLEGVTQFAADTSFVWVNLEHGTQEGIWQLDKSTGNWQYVSAIESAPPPGRYALTSHGSRVWAWSTKGTLYEHDLATETWKARTDLGSKEALIPPLLSYHAPDLWAGTAQGWARLDPETQQIARIPYPRYDIPVPPQGMPRFTPHIVWLPTQLGLYALDQSTDTWSRHAPTDRPIRTERILLASQDELLVSTGYQLGRLSPHDGLWHLLSLTSKELPWGMSTAAWQPNAPDLWFYAPAVGIPPKGETLQVWHREQSGGSAKVVEIPYDLHPTRLLPLIDEERLWFQTRNALISYRLETLRWQVHLVDSHAGHLLSAAQEPGSIWLIKSSGTLTRFDTRQHQFKVFPIPFGTAWSYIAVSEDTVWLGGESNTVLAFERITQRWTEHELDKACAGYGLSALAVSAGIVWAGGEHGVIHYNRETGQQTCYNEGNGMLSDQVAQIVTSGERVWFVHPWRGLWGYGPLREAPQ
jgi:ligand-binding sensor domain-containing protein